MGSDSGGEVNLKDFKKELLKDPKFRREYEKPPKLFEEGSYFSWINSEGYETNKTGRYKVKNSAPCKAEIVRVLDKKGVFIVFLKILK